MENQENIIMDSEQTQPQLNVEENKEREYVFIGQNDEGGDTSETSSYKSSDNEINEEEEGKKEKQNKPQEVEIDDLKMLEMMQADEFEEPSTFSYAKFKTQNEIDPENIEKFAPKFLILDELDEIVHFGKVQTYIQQSTGVILVSPNDPNQIYDLDNIIASKNKIVIGFVVDVVGPVNQPLYSVQLYPQYANNKQVDDIKNELVKEEVYVVKKCMKVITSQLPSLMNQKGCDASNFYDEELQKSDQEFSDDEKEREYKKTKKLAKQNKNYEEGELPNKPSKRKNKQVESKLPNKRFKETSYSKNGAQIPMYSANFPITQQQTMLPPQYIPQQFYQPPPYMDPYQQQFMPQQPYFMGMQMPYQQQPQYQQQQQQQQYPGYYPQYHNGGNPQ